MKVTIELSEAEVKGIREYLKEVDGEKPTAKDVKEYVQGMAKGIINAPQEAVSDYIAKYENS